MRELGWGVNRNTEIYPLKQIPKKGTEESVMSNYGNNIKILMHKHCVGKCAFHKGMV